MMKYRVAIRQTPDSPEPFWRSPLYDREKADKVARKNQRLIQREHWTHVVSIEGFEIERDTHGT